MASKSEDKPETKTDDPAPEKKKRPARTIDLKAEEVETADAGTGTPGEGGDAPDSAQKGEDATGPQDKGEDGPERHAGENGKPPPPPQRTQPSDLRAFATHLAAGFVGGLIGVVGAGIGLDKLPLPGLAGPGDTARNTVRIEQRLDDLAARLQDQSSMVSAMPPASRIDDIDKRVSALEDKLAPQAAEVPGKLDERLAALEQTLKAVQEAGSEPGASNSEQAIALAGRLEKLETALDERLAALASDLADARAMAEKSAEAASGSPGKDTLDAITARIGTLEEGLAGLADRPQPEASGSGNAKGALVALAFESLRRAAAAGKPFKAQLDALANAADGAVNLDPLEAPAAAGVAMRQALRTSLPQYLEAARDAAAHAKDETFLDRLATNAQSVVRIRRVGPVEGDGAAAVLSRVEAAAASGALEDVVAEAQSLDGAAAKALAPWLEKARARIALDEALNAVEAQLLSGLAAVRPREG